MDDSFGYTVGLESYSRCGIFFKVIKLCYIPDQCGAVLATKRGRKRRVSAHSPSTRFT